MPFEKKQIGPLFKDSNFDQLMAIYRSEPTWFSDITKMLLFDSAMRSANLEGLQFILDIGYDINEVSYTGTPLSRAARNGSTEVVQWLLNHGAKADESTISTNPLFSAIHSGNVELVRFFIAQGISTSKIYPCGRNALDFARTWDNAEVIAELGGDPNWKRPPWVQCKIPDLSGHKPSQEMLEAVESELAINIPISLKDFLINEFPDRLFFPEAKDNDEWVWLGEDHKLFHTARSMIAYNCIDARQKKKRPKFKRNFVFGTDGCGNDYCIRYNSNEDTVWIHDHETEEFECTNLSLRKFAELLIHELSSRRAEK